MSPLPPQHRGLENMGDGGDECMFKEIAMSSERTTPVELDEEAIN